MTRDEARSIILKQSPDLADTVSNITVLKLVDKIYDEFEKTCENCKFFGSDNGESWQEGYNQAKRDFKSLQEKYKTRSFKKSLWSKV